MKLPMQSKYLIVIGVIMAFSLNPLDWFKSSPASQGVNNGALYYQQSPDHSAGQLQQFNNGSFSPAGPVLGQGNVLGDSTQQLQLQPASAGGVAAAGPDLSSYKNDVQSRIGQLQNMYSQLFGTVDQNVADQRANYDKGYNTQQQQLGTDYQNSLGQLGQQYAGRGLADSSYLGDAQNQASQTYNTSLDSLNQNRDAAYANLGKFATTEKQQLGAGQQQLGQIDLGQYTDPTALLNLRGQLDQQLSGLQGTAAGLGTNAAYQSALQSATPAATQQGSAQLAAQLQKLKASGASSLVTNQIAQGLIKSAGKQNDPTIQNLWQSLQGA